MAFNYLSKLLEPKTDLVFSGRFGTDDRYAKDESKKEVKFPNAKGKLRRALEYEEKRWQSTCPSYDYSGKYETLEYEEGCESTKNERLHSILNNALMELKSSLSK